MWGRFRVDIFVDGKYIKNEEEEQEEGIKNNEKEEGGK